MDVEDQNPFRSPKYSLDVENKTVKEGWAALMLFGDSIEARDVMSTLLKRLENSGIESRVTNGLVMVLEEDAESALEITLKLLHEGYLADEAYSAAIAEWTCGCGETVDAGFEVCWSCEALYSDRPGAGSSPC